MQSPSSNNAASQGTAPTQTAQINTSTGTETPVAATPDPKEAALSPQFAALAKREKAIRAREAAVKAEKEQLARDYESKLAAARSEVENSYRSKLKQDLWGELSSAGMTPEEVTQMLLNQPTPQDQQLRTLHERLQKQDEEISKLKSQTENAETQSRNRAESLVKKEIELLVEGNEAFETIQAMKAHDEVLNLMRLTLEEDGYMMNVEDAAKQVEDYLVNWASEIAKSKKVQSKLTPPPAAPEANPAATKQGPPKQPQSQTLSAALRQQGTGQPLNERERRQRAINIFNGLNPDGTPFHKS